MAEPSREDLLKRMRLLEDMRQLEQQQTGGDPRVQEYRTNPATAGGIAPPLIDPIGAVMGAGAGGLIGGGASALMGGLAGGTSSQEGAAGANLGEAVGGLAGAATGPFAPVAVPAGATLGGTTGFILEELLTKGEPPSKKSVMMEAGMTLVPEIVETGIKAAKTPLRRLIQRGSAENTLPFMRGLKGGQVLRQAEQFRLLRGQGRQIFQAPTESAVKEAFDAVRASGARVQVEPLQLFLAKRTPAERTLLKREISRADAVLNQRLGTPGKRQFSPVFNTLDDIQRQTERTARQRAGGSLSRAIDPSQSQGFQAPRDVIQPPRTGEPLDVGDAQNLRSLLRERADQVSDPRTVDLLTDLKETVDAAIDTTLEGSSVRQARDMYRRFKAAEEMEGFFLKNSSLPTGRANIRTLRLTSLRQALDQAAEGEGNKATVRLYETIRNVPGAEDRLNRALIELEPFTKQLELNIGGGDVAGLARDGRIAAMFRGISEIMLSDRGIELFLDVAKQQKGRIDGNTVALILNATRRELAGLPAEE